MIVLCLATAPAPLRAGGPEHADDVVVGRHGQGQLAAEAPTDKVHGLFPIDGLLQGWAADEPGFMSLAADEPREDFFTLDLGAIVNLELMSVDPALMVWSPGFINLLNAPGQSLVIGVSAFDVHPTFHIDSTDPGFDLDSRLFSATFRLFDTGTTGYAPSETFALTFTPVPEPGTSLLLWLGAAGLFAGRARSNRRAKGNP